MEEDKRKEAKDLVLKSTKIEWEEVTRIRQFPTMLQGDSSANFLFSPDFKYMIDFNYSEKIFMISRLRKNVEKGKVRGSHSLCDFRMSRGLLPFEYAYAGAGAT